MALSAIQAIQYRMITSNKERTGRGFVRGQATIQKYNGQAEKNH